VRYDRALYTLREEFLSQFRTICLSNLQFITAVEVKHQFSPDDLAMSVFNS